MTPDINYAHAALFLAVGVALGYLLGLRPGYARAARQAAAFRELKRQEEAGLDRLARDLGLDPAAPAAIAPAPGDVWLRVELVDDEEDEADDA